MGHARALLMLEEEQQNQVALLIIARNLSVRETEKLVERIKAGKTDEEPYQEDRNLYQQKLSTLAHQLQTAVKLKQGKSGKGSLIIHYENNVVLQKIIDQLMN